MSETRFHIKPATNTRLAITLPDQVSGRNAVFLRSFTEGSQEAELIVKDGHLRFDKHPQGFLAYDGHEVYAYVKGWGGSEFTDYDNTDYHWKVVVLYVRMAGGNDVWGQVPDDFSLDYGYMKKRELRVLLVHPATRSALTMFQGGGMGVVSVPPQFYHLCGGGGGVLRQTPGDAEAVLRQLGNLAWIMTASSCNVSKQDIKDAGRKVLNVITGGLL